MLIVVHYLKNDLESTMSSKDKQANIEKAISSYDVHFFLENLNNKGNKMLILSREYESIMNYFDN